MALIHGQTWIDCARLIHRFIPIFLDLFNWILRHFLQNKGALLFQLVHVFLQEGLIFLILVQETHCSLKVFSRLLITCHNNFAK